MVVVAILMLLLVLAVLGVSFYAYLKTFASTKQMHNPDPVSFIRDVKGTPEYEDHKKRMDMASAVSYERVYIHAADGVRLSARYYRGKAGAPIVIFFHGYRSNAIHDGCGLHHIARSRDYHILLCDQRAHGFSRGRCLTFGVKERLDAKSWAEYAAKRFPGAPIFLSGISMGAATVLMAASLPLPGEVAGVLADCPYSSPKGIIMKVCAEMGLPPKLIYPFIRFGAIVYGGFDPNESDAIASVRLKTPPILMVHGLADTFVPAEMSKAIDAAASGDHKLILVDGADHGKSFTVAPELYVKTMTDFFDECLKKHAAKPAVKPGGLYGNVPFSLKFDLFNKK